MNAWREKIDSSLYGGSEAGVDIGDPFSHAIRMTILKLRRKLGDPPVMVTEPEVGYRIR